MSCSSEEEGSITELKAKRSEDIVPIEFDWHDFLAALWAPGKTRTIGDKIRPPRARATGFQYECMTAGVSGQTEPRWPKVLDATVTDGTAVWTAKALASSSLRTTISAEDFTADAGLTLGTESNADLVYTVLASGGEDGVDYLVKHSITCVNGEEREGVGRLPVRD